MFLFPKIQMSYYYSFIFILVWPKPTIQVQSLHFPVGSPQSNLYFNFFTFKSNLTNVAWTVFIKLIDDGEI